MSQDGSPIDASDIYLLAESDYLHEGNYDLTMALSYAILKLNLAELATETTHDISVKIGDTEEAVIKNYCCPLKQKSRRKSIRDASR